MASVQGTVTRTFEEIESSAAAAAEQRRQRRYIVRSLLKSPTFVSGCVILLFWIFMALFSMRFTADPYAVDPLNALKAPSGAHWFGTDDLGRDVFARTMAGARPVLVIAPAATALALIWGSLIGLVAGFYGKLVDDVVMRVVDVLLCIPTLIMAILVISLLGTSTAVVILVIAVLFTPLVARTVRSAAMGQREREYVLAARLRGERSLFIMTREVLPNISGPIVVEGTVRLGYAVFTAATISFLGFGLQPPSPDWGLTVSQQRGYLQIAWWTIMFAGIALASLVVAVNLISDGLHRVISE